MLFNFIEWVFKKQVINDEPLILKVNLLIAANMRSFKWRVNGDFDKLILMHLLFKK